MKATEPFPNKNSERASLLLFPVGFLGGFLLIYLGTSVLSLAIIFGSLAGGLAASPKVLRNLLIAGILSSLAATVRADAPAREDSVTLTLTATPSLAFDRVNRTDLADPWSPSSSGLSQGRLTFLETTFGEQNLGLSSTTRNRLDNRERVVYRRVLDTPGPGYRKTIEWFENMKRPLPKLGQ